MAKMVITVKPQNEVQVIEQVMEARLAVTGTNAEITLRLENGMWNYVVSFSGMPVGDGTMSNDDDLTPVQAAEKIAMLTNIKRLSAMFG